MRAFIRISNLSSPPHNSPLSADIAAMSATNSPSSSVTSVTVTEPSHDVESNTPSNHLPYLRRLFDLSGVTPAVLEWKYRGEGTADDPFLVDFLPLDNMNPMKFPQWKKWLITMLQAIAVLAVTFVSTAYSGGVSEILAEFKVEQEIVILGISLFVIGFALGPLFWAPLSEMFGRQRMFIITYTALTAFNAGAAASPNMAALIVFRFLGGTFGSSPLTNSGGVIADMFKADQRGLALALFASVSFNHLPVP